MVFLANRKLDYIETLPLLEVGETAKIAVTLETSDEDDFFFEREFKEVRSKNRIAQWGSDALMLIATHTQIYLLLFALSLNLRTAWSYQYTSYFSWTFWLQFDYWSWFKVESVRILNGTGAKSVWPTDSGYALSENIPIGYRELSLFFVCLIATVLLAYAVFVVVLHYRSPANILEIKAYGFKLFVTVTELLLIPYGVFAARWWWCRYEGSDRYDFASKNNKTDVYPELSCFNFSSLNTPNVVCECVTGVVFVYWVIVAMVIYRTIKQNVFTDVTIEHEGFILLKETEYVYGIDEGWLFSNYFLHSSFRRPWVYMRVYMFMIKGILILIYGTLFDYELQQGFVLVGFFFVICILLVLRRPYRLLSFNLMIFLSFFVNFWNAFVGVCIELDTQNAFTQDQYLKLEMILLNGGFYCICSIWILFLLLRWKKIIRPDRPLWPNLTKTTRIKQDLDEMTRKYLVSVIRARLLLQETYASIPLLAPAHELSRRVKILNAYSREAVLYDHVLQYTIWDVTDELIQAHTSVFKKSIFSDSSSYGSRESAKQLYEMLPMLGKRLKQRDEDLILMSRKRRRILLKMYTLSIFLHKHINRVQRELAEKRENQGYNSDSDFGDGEEEEYRQETPSDAPRRTLLDDSLLLDDTPLDTPEGFPTHDTSHDTMSQNVSMVSPVLVNESYTDFDNDISALLSNSVFEKSDHMTSTPDKHNTDLKRASYAGIPGMLSPVFDRPYTSPYGPRNSDQVLSFRKS